MCSGWKETPRHNIDTIFSVIYEKGLLNYTLPSPKQQKMQRFMNIIGI
jgi:hypothetical protein